MMKLSEKESRSKKELEKIGFSKKQIKIVTSFYKEASSTNLEVDGIFPKSQPYNMMLYEIENIKKHIRIIKNDQNHEIENEILVQIFLLMMTAENSIGEDLRLNFARH